MSQRKHRWYRPIDTSKAMPHELGLYVLHPGQGNIVGRSPEGNRVVFHLGEVAICVKSSRQRVTFLIKGDEKLCFWISIKAFRKSLKHMCLGEISQNHA